MAKKSEDTELMKRIKKVQAEEKKNGSDKSEKAKFTADSSSIVFEK